MHLKKVIAIGVLLFISGCSEHDKEYFEANIDEAELKANECQESMGAAFRDQDESKLESLSKDAECNFAMDVFNNHKRKLAKIKRESKKRELEKTRKAEEKIFEQQYSEQMVALKKLPYSDFFSIQKECGARFLSKKTPICKAYSDLKEGVEVGEIEVLKEKYSSGKLEEFRDASCKGMAYDDAYCALSTKAARQQKEERVNFYVSNRDELKKEFNKCHTTYKALRNAKKWQESNESIKTYQCDVIGKAAYKLKVYSFDKPIG